MSITVNDRFTLTAANTASSALKAAEGLLNEVERLIAIAEKECDVEIDVGTNLEDVQAAVVIGANEVNKAINSYVQGSGQ